MKIRRVAAILAGKTAIYLSRLLGNQGTDFPGRIALKIYPGILSELAHNIQKKTIIITGTNGKTTTTNMIAEIIRQSGHTYIHNRAGANMVSGITTAFIEKTSLGGGRLFDYALLETDEANVPLILKEIRADYLLITNFFRDQLDRYGELDHTINMIKDAARNTKMELVLNADDPLMVHFHNDTGLFCWYYGFDDTGYDTREGLDNREGRYCIFCGQELIYQTFHYAQLGKFHCPRCKSHNPDYDFAGRHLDMNPAIHFMVNDITLDSPYHGFHNAYNILAAVSLGRIIGIPDEVIRNAIASYQPRAGRMETFHINGKRTMLVLIKNPTGLNQSLSMLRYDEDSKSLFLALNDNAADGRDISWIWDADMEIINEASTRIKKIICSGLRSGDMAVRVKYSGFNLQNLIISSSLKEGIEKAVYGESEASYILCTYTALFQCRKILARMQKQARSTGEARRETSN